MRPEEQEQEDQLQELELDKQSPPVKESDEDMLQVLGLEVE